MGFDARWLSRRHFGELDRFALAGDSDVNERGLLATYIPNNQSFELEFYEDRLCLIEADQIQIMRYGDIERFNPSEIERFFRLTLVSRDKRELMIQFDKNDKGDLSAIWGFVLKMARSKQS